MSQTSHETLGGTVDPRYPIGRFTAPGAVSDSLLEGALYDLGDLPQRLREAVDDLDEEQVDIPYRPGGWTVRQVVHHVADSHMNAYMRFKLALTEASPLIKVYDEAAWAALHDGKDAPVEWSLGLVESLHARWLMLLRSLSPADWQRTFIHPEHGNVDLRVGTLMYAWHSRHHVAHITSLRTSQGW